MNKIITDKQLEIQKLCQLYSVKAMYAFGSVCTDKFNETSDIDFLISFSQNLSIKDYSDNYFELHYKLEELLHRNIDLLTDKSLSNPYFIQSIEQTKTPIYES